MEPVVLVVSLNPASNTISDTKSQVLKTGLLKKGDPGWENKERYNVKNSYEYDAYDLVLEYLISNGHADTFEEANYVMLQMNAEHIRNIVEGFPTIQGTLNPWEDPKTGKSGIKIKSVDKSGTTKEYGPLKGGVFIKQAQTQKKPTTQVAHFEPEGEVIDERLIDKLNPKNSAASKVQNTSPFSRPTTPLPSYTSPFAKPASRDDSGKLTTYGAGGGAAAERAGKSRAEVMRQGAKNLENKKPVNQGPDFGR